MNATKTVRIQAVGMVPSKRADEIQPGDILVWNFGYQSTVLGVERLSPQFVRVAMVTMYEGKESLSYRRMKNDRQVAIVTRKS